MEFSKKVTFILLAVALLLTVLAVILPIFGVSIEGINAALPYVWSAVLADLPFYMWKSKNDNRHKYAMLYVDKIAEKYGIENALRVAEVVLKE